MNKTSIEWTDFTWNPVTGCHKVSPGCKNCYAETITNRFAKTWGVESFRDVVMHTDRLSEPARNRKKWAGKKVFVCSMSDLFQEDVSFEFIAHIFHSIKFEPSTTFQVLTKRPDRVIQFLNWQVEQSGSQYTNLPNLWIGVSCENQETVNERIPYLIQIPAAVRFVSCEPLLGPINLLSWIDQCSYYCDHSPESFRNWVNAKKDDGMSDDEVNHAASTFHLSQHRPYPSPIHWVIAGGESGHGARPMHPDWVRSLRNQCTKANVPFFFKQWGEWIDNQNMPTEVRAYNAKQHVFNNGTVSAVEVWRVGKSKSGNTLDGVQHLNFPTI